MFFWNSSCFLNDSKDVGNLISGSSAFSKTSLNTWKFTVHVLLKPGLENVRNYFASVWDACNCAVIRAFFGIAFLRDWNENWPFPGKVKINMNPLWFAQGNQEKMFERWKQKPHRLCIISHWFVCVHARLFWMCPTLCDRMDCSPPGSSVHGILQARILEWVVMPSSRVSSQSRDQTHISYVFCISRLVLYH